MKWIDKVVEEILECGNDKQKIKDIIEDIYEAGYELGMGDAGGSGEVEGIPWEDLD